ncbi:MAG: ATP-binding cassette domain-containing protein, partial [Elusimicrobiota bacterium]|nr:ATP-binding cassette domain-containing protein [Elusimicrobiota bacterium]
MKNGLISVNIKSVCKKLSSNKALEDVSFVFEEGLIHAIVGPNGAGKTTLIRLIISLLKADKGQIEYFQSGTQISFADIKEEIGYFPQEQSLYADLSCMEHLRFFAKLYNISD